MNIGKILKQKYGLSVNETSKLTGGFRNQCFKVTTDKGNFTFIIYKREKAVAKLIKSAHKVARILGEKGFRVREAVLNKQHKELITIKLEDGVHYCALYDFLEGETIPWEGYTRRHLKSIGKTLSDIHHSLKRVDTDLTDLPSWFSVAKYEVKCMKKYFKKVEPWIEKKLKVRLSSANLEEIFEKILELDSEESCILHYDFLRGNILFSNKVNKKFDTYPIVGILDFEKVCFGPTVADIARSLAFLIIDVKYKSEDKIRKRFLISGYERRGKNKLPQIVKSGDFEILLKFFWLRDFWKFLENNPYEFLYMNEHYLRTRDRLIKAKAVEFVIKGDEVKS